jgi:hypothetical protein
MVGEETQRVKDLRERQVRQMRGDVLRRHAHPPQFHDGANRRSRSLDDRFAIKDRTIAHNIDMVRRSPRILSL